MNPRIAVLCVASVTALGQAPGPYPGQTPRPPIGGIPGTYPPGTYPPGTTIPIPGRSPTGTSRAPQPQTTVRIPPQRKVSITTGTLRRYYAKALIIESGDHRIVWFRLADDFRLEGAEEFVPGDQVMVEAVHDEEGNYSASWMRWLKPGTDAERALAVLTWDLPTAAQLPREARNDRPVVRRGGPRPKEEPPEEPASATKAGDRPLPGPLPQVADHPSVARAREAARSFLDTLPSFAARQSTMRYVREAIRGEWRALDVVTANLVYKDGEEIYSDIRVGRDRVEGRLEDIDGLRSTGEFGSLLEEIFDPETGTRFVRGSTDQINGRRAVKFSFAVPRDRSWFRIMAPSEQYFPAYRGTLWIDVETDRVLRLEQQAMGFPEAFPFDTVEIAVDYDFIRLEGTRTFLLPVEAQALECVRETSMCLRNQTSFRNYVKYESESGITFEKEPLPDRQ